MAEPAGSRIDAVVLAGGRSRRFGADKVSLLLDRVLAGLPASAEVVCVGPARPTRRLAVRWVREEPPLGGPLAAAAAGVAVGSAPTVLLTAADMPSIGLAVPALLAALGTSVGGEPVDGAVLVDQDGNLQVLATAWRRARLQARLAELDSAEPDSAEPDSDARRSAERSAGGSPGPTHGRPLRLLLEGARLVPVPDIWGAARDVDTPDDLD